MGTLIVEHQPATFGEITTLERPTVKADAETVDEDEGERGAGISDDLDVQRHAIRRDHRGRTPPDQRYRTAIGRSGSQRVRQIGRQIRRQGVRQLSRQIRRQSVRRLSRQIRRHARLVRAALEPPPRGRADNDSGGEAGKTGDAGRPRPPRAAASPAGTGKQPADVLHLHSHHQALMIIIWRHGHGRPRSGPDAPAGPDTLRCTLGTRTPILVTIS